MLSRIEYAANYLFWLKYHLQERLKEEDAVEALEWLVIMVAVVALGAAIAKALKGGGEGVGNELIDSLKQWAAKVAGESGGGGGG